MADTVSFNEFKRFDFRVAKIIESTDHPNADKLTVMKIDLGDKQKQIVAGIRPYRSHEELVGKYIVVLDNLEPATLRGETSEAMLLAALDGDVFSLATLDKEVQPGTKIL